MKIVVFIKGPVRPDLQFCLSNFHCIEQMFVGQEVKFVIHTWKSNLDVEFINHLHNKFDLIVSCNEPDRMNVERNLLVTRTPLGCGPFNAFKHFLTMKNASKLIYDIYGDYDYVFYFRIDTYYNIIDLNQCFVKDAYVTGVDKENCCDVFGFGNPENFMKAWDYKDLQTLNTIYGMSSCPEHCLGKIIRMNSVKCVAKNFKDLGVVGASSKDILVELCLHPNRN